MWAAGKHHSADSGNQRCCPIAEAGHGAPNPGRSELGWGVTRGMQLFSHLPCIYCPGARPAVGKGQTLSDVTLPPCPGRREAPSPAQEEEGRRGGKEGQPQP